MGHMQNETVQDRTSAGAAAATIREVEFDAPWNWLASGWRDLWRAPFVSLAYGTLFTLIAFALAWLLLAFERAPLLLPLAGGFLLVGPLLAVGLYEVSRALEAGEKPSLGSALSAAFRARGQLAFMGVILLIVYLLWVRLAFLLFMLFFGPGAIPPLADFVPLLLFSPQGIGLLVTGTICGAVLAGTVFAISVISIPMLYDRPVDTVTAILASIRAVAVNPKAMLLWAALLTALVILGVATLFAGLAIVFPLAGHATWHAYRSGVA
jgi:uncharacterized membrane protein